MPQHDHRSIGVRVVMAARSVGASIVVGASPADAFEVLADPHRHAAFDGSGTVRSAMSGPSRLGPGARFGMAMRWGLPYRISNTVVEFEEGRRIAWRHFGRHVWRYELEPVDGGTRITETFDYAPALAPRLLEWADAPRRNLASIQATLNRLVALLGPPDHGSA